MASVLKPQKYLVVQLLAAVTVQLSCEEFRELGNSNGLPNETILDRRFYIAEDCTGSVKGFNQEFKKDKRITDVKLAWTLIAQAAPITIQDKLQLPEGTVLPEVIGKPLAEAYPEHVQLVDEAELAEAVDRILAPDSGAPEYMVEWAREYQKAHPAVSPPADEQQEGGNVTTSGPLQPPPSAKSTGKEKGDKS